MIDKLHLKEFLDERVAEYNSQSFIEFDPISIPHHYSRREDIEISALIAATISWGNRKAILKSGEKMKDIFGDSPFDYVMSYDERKREAKNLTFVHRTFNTNDFKGFISALQGIYSEVASLEECFLVKDIESPIYHGLIQFRRMFFEQINNDHLNKHISNPLQNSACKRLNMFLRWMVRTSGDVDFGLWSKISPSQLLCPLDVHSGTVARKLGLLQRKQDDWKSVIELTNTLKELDAIDPIKYDFALFGIGVNKYLDDEMY
jgi:uncharacterized protein (TIGR02757 family)